MERVLVVTLPLPSRTLNPNGRPNRFQKAKAVKKYREDAHIAAIHAGVKNGFTPLEKATLQCHFYFRTPGRRDGDNLLASLKAGFDGLVDAGVFVDDSDLTHLPVTKSVDKQNPRVEIRIYKAD